MKGVRSISKDVVQKRIQEEDFKRHQQRIHDIVHKKINWGVDNTYDKLCQSNHLKSKIKSNKFKFEEKQIQINQSNNALVDKIDKIRQNHHLLGSQRSQSLMNLHSCQPTLNEGYRKKEAQKIASENSKLIKRLQNPKSCTVDNKVMLKDNEKYIQLRRNIQKHGFFADPIKKKKTKTGSTPIYRRIQLSSSEMNQNTKEYESIQQAEDISQQIENQQVEQQVQSLEQIDSQVDVIEELEKQEQQEDDKI